LNENKTSGENREVNFNFSRREAVVVHIGIMGMEMGRLFFLFENHDKSVSEFLS
jgi:hypothetical protein